MLSAAFCVIDFQIVFFFILFVDFTHRVHVVQVPDLWKDAFNRRIFILITFLKHLSFFGKQFGFVDKRFSFLWHITHHRFVKWIYYFFQSEQTTCTGVIGCLLNLMQLLLIEMHFKKKVGQIKISLKIIWYLLVIFFELLKSNQHISTYIHVHHFNPNAYLKLLHKSFKVAAKNNHLIRDIINKKKVSKELYKVNLNQMNK